VFLLVAGTGKAVNKYLADVTASPNLGNENYSPHEEILVLTLPIRHNYNFISIPLEREIPALDDQAILYCTKNY